MEIVDDEYPIVLVPGRALATAVHTLADMSYQGDVDALLRTALADYPTAVTHRNPSEILTTG